MQIMLMVLMLTILQRATEDDIFNAAFKGYTNTHEAWEAATKWNHLRAKVDIFCNAILSRGSLSSINHEHILNIQEGSSHLMAPSIFAPPSLAPSSCCFGRETRRINLK